MVGRELASGETCQNLVLFGFNQVLSSLSCQLVGNSYYSFSFSTSNSQRTQKKVSPRQTLFIYWLLYSALCDCPNILRAKHILLAIKSPEENKREGAIAKHCYIYFNCLPCPLNHLTRPNKILYTFVYSKTTLLIEGKMG